MKKILALCAIFLALTPAIVSADIQQATPLGGPVWNGYHPTAYGDFASDTRTDVVVTWSAPSDGGNPITGYQVIPFTSDVAGGTGTRSGVSCSTDGTGRTCTVKGLAAATYYTFIVLATNAVASASSASTTNKQASGDTSTVPAILTPGTDQTITLTNPPSPYLFGSADFQLSATASSGLPITWTSTPTSTCTVDATGIVHFLKAQLSCRITATQYGSSSGYKVVSLYKDAIATIALSATANAASAVQGTSATLNGVFPYSGAEVIPSFCVSATNPGSTAPTACTGSIGTVGSLSTALIDANSGTTSSVVVSDLLSGTQYWYWAVATSGASHAESNVISFTTLLGPTLTASGSLNGVVGTPMSVTFTATGGSGAYAAWDKGSLPAGLAITYGDSSAIVSGTPTTRGSTLTFIYVEDSGGLNTNLPVTFVIGDPVTPPPTSPTPPPVVTGPALQITLNEPTNVQSTSVELSASTKWLGTDGTPEFCISLIDSNETCSSVTGATIVAPNPSLTTATSGSAITTLISGLTPRTIYFVWAQLSNGSLVVKTPTRMIHTSAGPTLTYSGETRRSTGSLVKLTVKAAGGLAPYKNWQIKGLPAGLISSSQGVTSLISGTAKSVGAYAIEVSVVDANGQSGLITIPLTIYDESNPILEISGATTQLVGAATVQVKWEPIKTFIHYQVFLANKLACESSGSSCKIAKLLGPRAAISVYGKTATGKLSAPVHPTYISPAAPIEIDLVHFAFNSSALNATDKKSVVKLAKLMRGQGFTALMVIGHTDAIGGTELNTVLSGKRAKSTYTYLNSLLTNDPVSVMLVGKGFTAPVSDNATAKGRAANRRAAILVY